ncbi:MAG TPA: hypothetical protein VIX81_09310 [Gammaproteobacteria bacterium]
MPLIRLFFDLCLLRAKPQQVPASEVVFALALLAYLGVGVLVLAPGEGLPRALGQALLDTALLLALLRLALQWRRHPARFQQAATALTGTGALLGLLLLPVLALGGGGEEAGQQAAVLAFLLWTALFAWSLTVTGHILRHALELPLAGGVLCAVLYFAVSLAAVQAVFPRAPT